MFIVLAIIAVALAVVAVVVAVAMKAIAGTYRQEAGHKKAFDSHSTERKRGRERLISIIEIAAENVEMFSKTWLNEGGGCDLK